MTGSTHGPVFVVFEGLDGAGKTTCAQELATLIGARYMTTPSPEVRQSRHKIISSFGGSQEAAHLFYLSTVFAASDQIRRDLDAGISIVLDRYFLSTQVYAQFRGSALDLDGTGARLVQPDLTVYLDTPRAIRKERLSLRGSCADDMETLTAQADQRLGDLYRQKSSLPVVGRWFDCPVLDKPAAVAQQIAWELVGRYPAGAHSRGEQA